MSVDIGIPPVVPVLFVVLFVARGVPPTEGDLRRQAERWVVRHVDDPLGAELLAWSRREVARLEVHPVDHMVLPSRSALASAGLGVDEAAHLDATTHAVVVGTVDRLLPPRPGLWWAIAAARGLARHLGGVIYDPELRAVLPVEVRDEPLPRDGAIDLREHLRVAANPVRGGWWMTSHGLARFGLPDLEVCEVPGEVLFEAMGLVHRAAAALHGRARALALGGGPARLKLTSLHLPWRGNDAAPIGLSFAPFPGRAQPFLRLHPPAGDRRPQQRVVPGPVRERAVSARVATPARRSTPLPRRAASR